ncbi:MAG: hypothetical protein IJ024_02800 [Lachnospiraceae bacterium]|nr:hypothetical protein [Lachnospiraceae bacterium]
MKKIISMMLTALMLLGLTGCGATDAEKMVGTWSTEINISSVIEESLELYEEYFDFSDLVVVMTMTFNEDGTYSSGITEEDAQVLVDDVMSEIESNIVKLLEDQIADQGLSMTVDEMLAFAGMTLDDFTTAITEAFEQQDLVGVLVEQSASEGKYDAKDGKLYLSAGLDYEVDESMYDTYELDGDTLTLLENVGGEEAEFMLEAYPLVMTRETKE